MHIQGVIFDLDGTLGDSIAVGLEAFRRTFRHFTGKEYADHEIRALWGPSEEGVFMNFAPDRWQEYLQVYLSDYEQVHRDLEVGAFPGIHDVIELLKSSGVRVAVVTAKGPHSAAISLRFYQLSDAFEYVESGSIHGLNKAERIEYVVGEWDLPKDRILYIGDVVSDITAAREAGVVPVSVAWAPQVDAEVLAGHHPAQLFTTTEDFHAWLAAQLDGVASK